jgi:hypothetical protein
MKLAREQITRTVAVPVESALVTGQVSLLANLDKGVGDKRFAFVTDPFFPCGRGRVVEG